MLRSKDLFEHVCTECGRVFRSDKEKARKCPSCQEAVKRKCEIRKLEETKKQRQQDKEFMRAFKDKALPGGMDAHHPLRVRVRKIQRYNEEHGTCYTYGQFESLLHNGFIKV